MWCVGMAEFSSPDEVHAMSMKPSFITNTSSNSHPVFVIAMFPQSKPIRYNEPDLAIPAMGILVSSRTEMSLAYM